MAIDPVVKVAIDVVGALFQAFGKPLIEAALSHHGYVPRRVEAVLGPDDHGHASEAADALRGTAPANPSPVEPEAGGGRSPRWRPSADRKLPQPVRSLSQAPGPRRPPP